jgi:hypothetical protein
VTDLYRKSWAVDSTKPRVVSPSWTTEGLPHIAVAEWGNSADRSRYFD